MMDLHGFLKFYLHDKKKKKYFQKQKLYKLPSELL